VSTIDKSWPDRAALDRGEGHLFS